MQHINNILEVLQKPPQKRTPRDIFLLQNETKSIQFFKQYNDSGDTDIHNKCCVSMKHQYMKKDQVVFHIDTTGSKFYLILEGTVGVYIRLPKKRQESEDNQQENTNQIDNDLVCVKELNAGTGFGELALMNNKPRLASIICHSNCHFATLDKKEFNEILKEKEEEKLIKEMGFFASLPFFKGWNFNLVKLLYLNSVRVNFVKGDRIYKEGSEPLAVYIIVSGEFVLEKSFYKDDSCDHLYKTSSQEVRHLMGSNKKASKQFQISVYTNPELFGDEEIMEGVDYRKCTAICNSAQGQCILIKKRDFELRIMHEEGALNYLQERLAIKNERMKEKIESITKQIMNYKNFIYDDPKDFKKQAEFQKIYRTQQGRQQLKLQSLSDLKEMIQTGQDPAKKKKKYKENSQPDINFLEEGLIKSQNEIQVNNSKEDEEQALSPSRVQSPSKIQNAKDKSALKDHFLEMLQQHVNKQKKKETKNLMISSQNFSKSQIDLSQLEIRSSLLPSQQYQKFSSFQKFDGQEYSPTLHKINKSQVFLNQNEKNLSKTHLPSLNKMNNSAYDSSPLINPQISGEKFQKLKLQQTLMRPPNFVKQYDNPDGEDDEKEIKKHKSMSRIYLTKQNSQTKITLPTNHSQQENRRTKYNILSQSQIDFRGSNNDLIDQTEIKTDQQEENKIQQMRKQYQKSGKSQSQQIYYNSLQIANEQLPYKIKIQGEDDANLISNYETNSQTYNNNTNNKYNTQFSNEYIPNQIQSYTKQNTPDIYLNSPQINPLDNNKIENSIYLNHDQQILYQQNNSNLIPSKSFNQIPSIQMIKNSKNEIDLMNLPLNGISDNSNFIPPLTADPPHTNSIHKSTDCKNNNLSYRSISCIIQNNIKLLDPQKVDSLKKSSEYLNEQIRFQKTPQKQANKSIAKNHPSSSKSPNKSNLYKFQIEYQASNAKKAELKLDKQFQISKQNARIYEAIHHNPKTTKSTKDIFRDSQSTLIKSPKQKLLPIKAQFQIYPSSHQTSPIFSRQTDINTAYSELNSPIQTQKQLMLLNNNNKLRKSDFSLCTSDSSSNNNNNKIVINIQSSSQNI
ncbi:cyclic nucleotide-binding domain protein (macronuclear) [Tetrahymena thermophila SB210]|uniref:Cyclic nucleotide-binding domain protein n=1 Tax=Tetrahymena thermophila (strain SB210) TaxID=312017 RepID=Q23NL0_TETTS|nr:cyclic nucleotide-binding domain protein [Tetrahymena thermophila SB210]EAR98064.2 cyclic nucleotide-binding domain protein [Tetrahymena thermophila SB210]|eukprot:XP_001018309.2 cyclic nucleotide-binding domain protein [Tetrahymena thermophila SB210]